MLLNGVREAAIAAKTGSTCEKERGMSVSLRESVQQVSDPRNLDASVEEVFRLMLGVGLPIASAFFCVPAPTN